MRERGLKVVLLITDLERGGTPLRLAGLACGLKAAGVDVHVGCLAPRGPVSNDLEAAGVSTFACHARSVRSVGAMLRLLGKLRRIQPDLIHAALTHANVAARLVGGYLGIPVLTSTATIEVERRWHLWIERRTAGWDRGHIVNSRALADHVATAFRRRREQIHVVPMALERFPQLIDRAAARRQFQVRDGEFVVLWAGRFDPVKRLDLILQVARLCKDPPVRFLLAGDGPLRSRIEADVRGDAGLAERVSLLGWLDDLSPALSAADVFLFPSLTEGTPNAVLQAMAAGVPVIGSDIPALRELAGGEGRLRLVSEPSAEAYSAELSCLQSDPALGERLGAASSSWALENLDHQKLVQAVISIYESVLAREESTG